MGGRNDWGDVYSTIMNLGGGSNPIGVYPSFSQHRNFEWGRLRHRNSIESTIGRYGSDASLIIDSMHRSCTTDLKISFMCCNTARNTVNHDYCRNCDGKSPHGIAYWFWHHLNGVLPDVSVVGHRWGAHLTRCIGKIRVHRNNGLEHLKNYVDEHTMNSCLKQTEN